MNQFMGKLINKTNCDTTTCKISNVRQACLVESGLELELEASQYTAFLFKNLWVVGVASMSQKAPFFTACLGSAFTASAEEAKTWPVRSTEVHTSSSSEDLIRGAFSMYAGYFLAPSVWADSDQSEMAVKQQWQRNILQVLVYNE